MIHLYPQIKKNYYKSDLKSKISSDDSQYQIFAYLDTKNPKNIFTKGKKRGK